MAVLDTDSKQRLTVQDRLQTEADIAGRISQAEADSVEHRLLAEADGVGKTQSRG